MMNRYRVSPLLVVILGIGSLLRAVVMILVPPLPHQANGGYFYTGGVSNGGTEAINLIIERSAGDPIRPRTTGHPRPPTQRLDRPTAS